MRDNEASAEFSDLIATKTIQRAFAPRHALDWSKPLRTRNGRLAVRIGEAPDDLIVEGPSHAVMVQDRNGFWTLETYHANGRYDAHRRTSWDLINAALLDGTPLTGDYS